MICQLDEHDYCARHRMHHRQREKKISQMDNRTGRRYRRHWDKLAGLAPDQPADGLACVHRGQEIRREKCTKCPGDTAVKVFVCALHRECSLERKVQGVTLCRGCRTRQPPAAPAPAPAVPPVLRRPATPIDRSWKWISTQQLVADTLHLGSFLPPDVTAIAGIPRSGMLPASVLATHLHLPLWELTEEGTLRRLGHGSRGRNLGFPSQPGRTLVIDDTVYGGAAMRKARRALQGRPALFAAVYARPEAQQVVDLYGKLLVSPHLLEWNAFNNGPFAGHAANPVYGRGLALDMDGILCHDPDCPDADDGPGLERYREWLVHARPKWLPRSIPARVIITARLERWRPETVAWLATWRVPFEQLFMHPAEAASQREQIAPVAAWKADIYRESRCGFLLESNRHLAQEIHRLSRKPVIHPDSGTIFR